MVDDSDPGLEAQFEQLAQPAVKREILEILGRPFLVHVLSASEEDIDQWLVSGAAGFGSEEQDQALLQLWIILQMFPEDDSRLGPRRMRINLVLESFHEGRAIPQMVRGMAGGEPLPDPVDGSLEEMIERLTLELYPSFLLPADPDGFMSPSPSVHQYPMRSRIEAKVMADEVLARMFPRASPESGRSGSVMCSTGRGGGIQLALFCGLLVGSGWRAARLESLALPSADEHVRATLGQLRTIRECIAGGGVPVPVRVGLAGILLPEGSRLELGWGVLRPMEERDRHLMPRGHLGEVEGSDEDGSSFLSSYGGDVVLETTLMYRCLVADEEFSAKVKWPNDLRDIKEVQRRIESVHLAALLSQPYGASGPAVVVTSWQYAHDPLAYGQSSSWPYFRGRRSLVPRKLTVEQANAWRDMAIIIEAERVPRIDVAVRRALLAASERNDHEDMLVDAVIAWENLVGSQQGEPTLRVSAALSWLLEDDMGKRLERRSEIAKLYHLRSNVVHGGQLSSAQVVPRAQRALELTVLAIRKILVDRPELLKECKDSNAMSERLLMGG